MGDVVFLKRIIIGCINFYILKISPMFPRRCRFYPTCSRYFLDSVEEFGVFRGCLLGFLRLLRCNPLFKGGVDPVKKKIRKNRKK